MCFPGSPSDKYIKRVSTFTQTTNTTRVHFVNGDDGEGNGDGDSNGGGGDGGNGSGAAPAAASVVIARTFLTVKPF